MSLNIRIECLPEPNLLFRANEKGVEPRRVMAKHGAADKSVPRELRIGIVGPAAEVQIARAWRATTNCAIRMPRVMRNGSFPRLIRITPTSPR